MVPVCPVHPAERRQKAVFTATGLEKYSVKYNVLCVVKLVVQSNGSFSSSSVKCLVLNLELLKGTRPNKTPDPNPSSRDLFLNPGCLQHMLRI